MTIAMGLDQHRAQITADWLDTDTGEVSRARVARADRAGVRRFLERCGGRELEVAPEATTGWRFVVEELRRVGATVHLAEPAETAARRGNKKRAKNDRADARHLRELVMPVERHVAVGRNGVARRGVRLLFQWAGLYRLDHRLGHRDPRRATPTQRHLTAAARRGRDPMRRERET